MSGSIAGAAWPAPLEIPSKRLLTVPVQTCAVGASDLSYEYTAHAQQNRHILSQWDLHL